MLLTCLEPGVFVLGFLVLQPLPPNLYLLAIGSDSLLDHHGEVPSIVTAPSEANHQIQMLLKYFKAEL